ncbi:MAG: hypothetical protein D6716_02425, partial [Chloroflexi bacterium]
TGAQKTISHCTPLNLYNGGLGYHKDTEGTEVFLLSLCLLCLGGAFLSGWFTTESRRTQRVFIISSLYPWYLGGAIPSPALTLLSAD